MKPSIVKERVDGAKNLTRLMQGINELSSEYDPNAIRKSYQGVVRSITYLERNSKLSREECEGICSSLDDAYLHFQRVCIAAGEIQ